MPLIHKITCRNCHSEALVPVIDLGEQYLQNVFLKKGYPKPSQRKIPMQLLFCDPTKNENGCGLLQTAYTVPPDILYSTYWYRSGTNQTMRNHLKNITREAVSMIKKKRAKVLDIGCNDGTLLKCYPKSYKKYGVDPSNAAPDLNSQITIIHDIFPSVELDKKVPQHYFDVITSIAMFYDVEDPLTFIRHLKKLLSPSGLWILEVFYMPKMLEMGLYDTICHEHLTYLSLAAIENILDKVDMKLVKVSLNTINGSSIKCFITHKTNFKFSSFEDKKKIYDLRAEEFDLELDTAKPYQVFQEEITKHKEELSALLKALKRQGKRIHIYGASTKGNTLLQFCALDNSVIDFAADRNPDKDGAVTVGTNIPIISEEKSRSMKPDYYLVLPWAFKEEFVKREQKTLKSGTGFIFPFPKIEIVSH